MFAEAKLLWGDVACLPGRSDRYYSDPLARPFPQYCGKGPAKGYFPIPYPTQNPSLATPSARINPARVRR